MEIVAKMEKNELKNEIEQYINNLRIATEAFELNKGIKKLVKDYQAEINSIGSFNKVTLISLQTTFIMETCKLVDIRENKNIFKLLNICESNYSIFPEESIIEVPIENGEIETFINKINVREDIINIKNELNKFNNIIEHLKGLRDQYYAHCDKEFFFESEKVFQKYHISYEDISELLNLLLKSLNKILIDLCNESYMFIHKGTDEFEKILQCIKNRN